MRRRHAGIINIEIDESELEKHGAECQDGSDLAA